LNEKQSYDRMRFVIVKNSLSSLITLRSYTINKHIGLDENVEKDI